MKSNNGSTNTEADLMQEEQQAGHPRKEDDSNRECSRDGGNESRPLKKQERGKLEVPVKANPPDGTAKAVPVEKIRPQGHVPSIAEIRYALAQRRAVRQGQEESYPDPIAPAPRKWRRRIKRSVSVVALIVIPGVLGLLLFTLLGESGTQSLSRGIDALWWPMTAARLCVFALIAAVLAPLIARRIRRNAMARIEALRAELFAEDDAVDVLDLQAIEAQEEKIRAFRLPFLPLFLVLLGLDLLFMQLPYLLS